MDLCILQADGRPAAGAVVSIADAPVPVPDLGLVADAEGRLHLAVGAAGRWRLSIWHRGHGFEWAGWLAPGDATTVVRLSR